LIHQRQLNETQEASANALRAALLRSRRDLVGELRDLETILSGDHGAKPVISFSPRSTPAPPPDGGSDGFDVFPSNQQTQVYGSTQRQASRRSLAQTLSCGQPTPVAMRSAGVMQEIPWSNTPAASH